LKTVPSLPQSGLLSQLRLVSLLTQHGYSETSTPMLFLHHTHSTAFTLTVDDFLARYSHSSELDHLVSCLSTLYELKVHRDSPRNTYLGYTIDHSPSSPSFTLYDSLSLCPTASPPFGLWVHLLSCHLHFSRISHRHAFTPSTLHHCITTCLACGEDLDPTGGWILALLRTSPRPLHPYCCMPTLLLLSIQPNPTCPYCRPSPVKLCLLPSQPSQNCSPLIHGSLGLHRRQLPGSVAGCSVGLGDPPHYLLNPPFDALPFSSARR
jgi:hypothetical protein